ncbi:MAG: serine/threonine protein phosphatase [Deltaproteobacteria bacterium]|nr:MAG: serine/threonine protein phosphatase [Deltaproteobacteria bacterium]
MKLLLFSDLHCHRRACERLVEMAHAVDIVVGAGDYGNIRRGLDVPIGILRQIEKPAILVPGNNESVEELEAACACWPSARVLHGTGTRVGGLTFFGVGGGIPVTPFGAWSYDFTEEEAGHLLAPCPPGAVLVTHAPPWGCLDRSSWGRSLGSRSIRAAIEAKSPILVVCGHIHGSAGKAARIGETPVVNAGPDGYLWELSVPLTQARRGEKD